MEYISQYKMYLINEGKSKNTINSYLNDINEFYIWYSEKNNCGLDKIIGLDIQEYVKYLENDHIKVSSCFLQVLFHKSCKLKTENIATGISTMLQTLVFMTWRHKNQGIADIDYYI